MIFLLALLNEKFLLQPENLLLDSKQNVKIADFGLSNIMTDGEFLRTSCGSPNYAAPEVISGKLYAGPEVDVWSCGVILYALLCGTLPFDDDHVPSLFRKIKSGIFPIPEYLDKGVINLLLHMLQVDPMKRATIKEVLAHEWFQTDLPQYLFPPVNESEASIVDILAVKEVAEKFNSEEDEVTNALLSGDPHNQLLIAYNLIVDNKRIADSVSHSTAKMSLEETEASSASPNDKVTPHPERLIKAPKNLSPALTDIVPKEEGNSNNSSATGNSGKPKGGGTVKRAKWHLGIRSQSRPEDIMYEVYRAMKSLDLEWKLLNPYHVVVRRKLPGQPEPGGHKMSLQLYQVDGRSYLLDFKSLVEEEGGSLPGSRHSSVSGSAIGLAAGKRTERAVSLPMAMELETPPPSPTPAKQSQTMHFFEMCASLIGTLAR